MKLHPAKALFLELFNKEAQDPGPYLPTYFVPRFYFHSEVKKRGIPHPESDNFVAWCEWEESIGLPTFCHKIIAKYHKEHGSDFTAAEKGQWRLHRKIKR